MLLLRVQLKGINRSRGHIYTCVTRFEKKCALESVNGFEN